MLELKDALGANGLRDGGEHARLIVGMDVFVEPGAARVGCIGDEVATLEVTHLAPVRTHSIDDLRRRAHECMEPLLVLAPNARQLEPRADAGEELASRERLDQVIVGSRIEPLDARLLAGAGGQQDDRDVAQRVIVA
jgi:hypothetical protein